MTLVDGQPPTSVHRPALPGERDEPAGRPTAATDRRAPWRVAGTARVRRRLPEVAPFVLCGLAAGCAAVGLHPVRPSTLGSMGLLPVLSPVLLAGFPLLVAALVVELARPRPRTGVLALITALGVLAVYGLQPAVEPVARVPVGWLHLGFADYIAGHGAVLAQYDARFSWPGFFSLLAMLTSASGQPDASVLLNWTPVVLSGLAVIGVRAVAVAVLGPGRTAWIAAWIFLATNWTEQDYLSPQGTSYLLLLAALALTFQYLVRPGPLDVGRTSLLRAPVPRNTPRDRLLAEGLVVLIALALAPTHQLTPYVLAGLLGLVALWGRLWMRWLPVLVLLAALSWFALGAKDFWLGQLQELTGSIGHLDSSVNQGFAARLSDDPGRELILGLRIGTTLAVGLLALGGLVLVRGLGGRTQLILALAVGCFGLALLQPYGGEVFIRCYLFALPVLALPGALAIEALIVPHRRQRRRVLAVGAGGLLLTGLVLATVGARGGNDAYVAFDRSDLDAVAQAYRLAGSGESVATVVGYAPALNWQRVGDLTQGNIESDCADLREALDCVRRDRPDLLIIGAAQDNYGHILDGLPAGWSAALTDRLVADGTYRRVFRSGAGQVLRLAVPLAPAPGTPAPDTPAPGPDSPGPDLPDLPVAGPPGSGPR